jgi:hypothetical protein
MLSGKAVAVDATRGKTRDCFESAYGMIPNRSSSEKRSFMLSFAKSADPVPAAVFRELFPLAAGILHEHAEQARPAND